MKQKDVKNAEIKEKQKKLLKKVNNKEHYKCSFILSINSSKLSDI